MLKELKIKNGLLFCDITFITEQKTYFFKHILKFKLKRFVENFKLIEPIINASRYVSKSRYSSI